MSPQKQSSFFFYQTISTYYWASRFVTKFATWEGTLGDVSCRAPTEKFKMFQTSSNFMVLILYWFARHLEKWITFKFFTIFSHGDCHQENSFLPLQGQEAIFVQTPELKMMRDGHRCNFPGESLEHPRIWLTHFWLLGRKSQQLEFLSTRTYWSETLHD